MRNELIERQKSEIQRLSALLENVESQLHELEAGALNDTKLRHLARLIVEGKLLTGNREKLKSAIEKIWTRKILS